MCDTPVDYLNEDPEIPGQKFVLLSFLPPKEAAAVEFLRPVKEILHETVDSHIEEWCSEVRQKIEESGDLAQTLRRYVVEMLGPVVIQREQLWEKAVKHGSMGGIKVRGVFDDDAESLKAAEERSKMLSKIDRHHHIFRGSVGYWLPFNQPVSTIENAEYTDEKLNDLMKSYLQNKIGAEVFEKQRQQNMQEKAIQKEMADRQGAAAETTATEEDASPPKELVLQLGENEQ